MKPYFDYEQKINFKYLIQNLTKNNLISLTIIRTYKLYMYIIIILNIYLYLEPISLLMIIDTYIEYWLKIIQQI